MNLRVDPDICMGFRECTELAPRSFQWVEENHQSVAVDPPGDDDASLRRAVTRCPAEAIQVIEG